MSLSYSYLQTGSLYQIRELSSLLALLSSIGLAFSPLRMSVSAHFSRKGKETSL